MSNYDVTIRGRGFFLDMEDDQFAGPSSVALMRTQADTSGRPDESSLNREDSWTRTMTSWHLGAGQRVYDGPGSEPARFFESRGVDPWTENELSLLPAMATVELTDNINRLVAIGRDRYASFLFALVAGSIYWWDAIPSMADQHPDALADFQLLTGGGGFRDLTTDGTSVYATDGADVYRFAPGDTGPGTAWNQLDCDRLYFARGRLLATKDQSIYDLTNAAHPTAPAAAFTHGNASWRWTGFAEAGPYIYAAGSTDSISMVYKLGITEDTAELDAPVPAVQLPDGESVQTIYGYAGFILIGTNLGVRLAQPDAQGYLTYGALIPVGHVTAFEGERNFVWVGTTALSVATMDVRMWRLDLFNFTDALTPAYAEDLLPPVAPTLTNVNVWPTSIVTFMGKRYMGLAHDGATDGFSPVYGYLFRETDDLVEEGWVDGGRITYGLTKPKTALSYEILHYPLSGTPTSGSAVELMVANDYAAESSAEYIDLPAEGSTLTRINGGNVNFRASNPRLILRRASADPTDGPQITSLTFNARPVPERFSRYVLPLLIAGRGVTRTNTIATKDIAADIEWIREQIAYGAVNVTILGWSFVGFIEDYQFRPRQVSRDRQNFTGVMYVVIKEPPA